jgi:GWxTD domain-containing protein
MKTRLLLCLAVMALVVPALMAGSLDKYKNWPNSPQGYFMTASERAEWKAKVNTDADAEQFIKSFLAKRDAGFADDVVKRAEMADKHLTVGGRAGSLTTRGKIVILLGPPSSFSVAQRDVKGSVSGSSEMYGNVSDAGRGGGGGQGPSVGDMTMAASRQGMSGGVLKDYTFVYAADKLPVKQAKDLTVIVEVRPGDGTDRINDRKVAAQLDDIFDAAAQKSIAAAAAPAPKP